MAFIQDLTPLFDIAAQLVDAYKGTLQSKGYKNQELLNFTWNFTLDGNIFRLDARLPQWWDSFEYGRSTTRRRPGKMPPVKTILQWITVKNVVPPAKMTKEGYAWAIAKKISIKGLNTNRPVPGANLWRQTYDANQQIITDLCTEIAKLAYGENIKPDLLNITKGLNNIKIKQ